MLPLPLQPQDAGIIWPAQVDATPYRFGFVSIRPSMASSRRLKPQQQSEIFAASASVCSLVKMPFLRFWFSVLDHR